MDGETNQPRDEVLYASARTLVVRTHRQGVPVVCKSCPAEVVGANVIDALHNEAALLTRLRGAPVPDLLRVEHGRGGTPVLVLRDEGHHALCTKEPWSMDAFLDTAPVLARSLAAIHERGIVHRDINPANILYRAEDGDVRIADFGIATDRAAPATELTGTLPYLSPEQTARTQSVVDDRSDLYALGTTLYEMLLGRTPFSATDASGWIYAHLTEPVPHLQDHRPEVPDMVDAIVWRLLAKDAAERYHTAANLAADLERCRDEWITNGTVASFELRHRKQALRWPAGMVGRDRFVEQLATQIARGPTLVRGQPGMGKATTVGAALRTTPDRIVLRASCAPESSTMTLSTVRSLAGAWVRRALALEPSALDEKRRFIRETMGAHADYIGSVCRDVGVVLDTTSVDAPVDPMRRDAAFGAFFAALAKSAGGLVLRVDGIEHIDPTSRAVLDRVVRVGADAGLRLVATTTADDDNPWFEHLPNTAVLELDPLRPEDCELWLQQTLSPTNGEDLTALSLTVFEKTGGAPGAIVAFMEQRYRDNLIEFSDGVWSWDADAIRACPCDARGVDALLASFADLPPTAQRGIAIAACFRGPFAEREAVLLEPDARIGLVEAKGAGLVRPADAGTISFVDERVRDAIESSLNPKVRAAVHAEIARRLGAQHRTGADVAHQAALVAAHWAAATDADATNLEVAPAIAAFSEVAGAAQAAADYATALTYYERALGLPRRAHDAGPTAFDLRLAASRCALAVGALDRAQAHLAGLRDLAPDAMARAAADLCHAALASQEGRLADALAAVTKGLGELGLVLPATDAEIGAALGVELEALGARMQRVPPAALASLPLLEDPITARAMDLLFQAVPAAFQTNPPLFLLITLTMYRLTVDHGLSPAAAKAVADVGIVVANAFGDFGQSVALGDAALAIAERFSPHPVESSVHFIRGSFLLHLRDPWAASLAALDVAGDIGARLGDTEHAAYAKGLRASLMLTAGFPLADVRADGEQAFEYAAAVESEVAKLLGSLSRLTADAIATGAEALAALNALAETFGENQNTAVYNIYTALATVHWWRGEVDEAWSWLRRAIPLAKLGQGMAAEPHFWFLVVLAATHRARRRADTGDDHTAALVNEALDRLRALAAVNEAAHGPLAWLAGAAAGRATGSAGLDELVAAYTRVVAHPEPGFLPHRALALQLHGELWAERGGETVAGPLFREASAVYLRWGCTARDAHLRAGYPHFFAADAAPARVWATTQPSTVTADSDTGAAVELEAVMKASRAIASERTAQGAAGELLRTVMTVAGAEAAHLLVPQAGGALEVSASVDATGKAARPDQAEFVRPVVRRSVELRESVVVANAADDDALTHDPRVSAGRVRSLLCTPLVHQGDLVGVVYLENNALPGAFRSKHIDFVQMLAGQAAVALENLRVVEDLENLVLSRTKQLEDQTREVTALLDSVPQAIFTIGPDLTIGPRWSASVPEVLGEDAPTGRDAVDVLTRCTTLPADQQDLLRSALLVSFGSPLEIAVINWGHLPRQLDVPSETGPRQLQLDWVPIVDELDEVGRVTVVVRDVTEFQELAQKARQATEQMQLLDGLMAAGAKRFARFAQTELARLQRMTAMTQDLHGFRRELHTLKGNARQIGLRVVAQSAHALEDRLVDPDDNSRTIIARTGVETLQRLVGQQADMLKRLGQDDTASAAAEARLVEDVRSALSATAAALNHPTPALRVEGRWGDLPEGLLQPLGDALGHIVRNAVDHGFGPPQERVAAGKPPYGTFSLVFSRAEGRPRLELSDDGQGLDLATLRARGCAGTDEELANLVFEPGLSTRQTVSATSGRGVGMDAVREGIKRAGGDVHLVLAGEPGAARRPFTLVIDLPVSLP